MSSLDPGKPENNLGFPFALYIIYSMGDRDRTVPEARDMSRHGTLAPFQTIAVFTDPEIQWPGGGRGKNEANGRWERDSLWICFDFLCISFVFAPRPIGRRLPRLF